MRWIYFLSVIIWTPEDRLAVRQFKMLINITPRLFSRYSDYKYKVDQKYDLPKALAPASDIIVSATRNRSRPGRTFSCQAMAPSPWKQKKNLVDRSVSELMMLLFGGFLITFKLYLQDTQKQEHVVNYCAI